MALLGVTIDGARPVPTVAGQGNYTLLTWAGFADVGDVGAEQLYPEYPDRSVQVSGTFGTGGAITIEGSNDGTNWYALRDPFGDALLFSFSDVRAILETTRWIRPRQSAGTGANINVDLFGRGKSL